MLRYHRNIECTYRSQLLSKAVNCCYQYRLVGTVDKMIDNSKSVPDERLIQIAGCYPTANEYRRAGQLRKKNFVLLLVRLMLLE